VAQDQRQQRWRFAPIFIVVGLIIAGVSVFLGFSNRARPVHRGNVPTTAATRVDTAAPAPGAASSPGTSAGKATAVGSLPTGLRISQLGVTAAITPVPVAAGGALVVPTDVHTVGWWAGGALPGTNTGTVVLDGHVDSASAGDGALFNLRNLSVGTTVTVTGTPTNVSYRITGLREYDKGNLPAASIFAQSGPPRLVLITCGGPFNATTRHYRDNVVAFGVPTS
jgi:hypothetical protein